MLRTIILNLDLNYQSNVGAKSGIFKQAATELTIYKIYKKSLKGTNK